jgi:hypothetical protein
VPLPGLAVGGVQQAGAAQGLELAEAVAGGGVGFAGSLVQRPGLGETVGVQPERGFGVVALGLAPQQEHAAGKQGERARDQRAPQAGEGRGEGDHGADGQFEADDLPTVGVGLAAG